MVIIKAGLRWHGVLMRDYQETGDQKHHVFGNYTQAITMGLDIILFPILGAYHGTQVIPKWLILVIAICKPCKSRSASNFSPLLTSRYPGAGRAPGEPDVQIWSIALSVLTATGGSWPDPNQEVDINRQSRLLTNNSGNIVCKNKLHFWTRELKSITMFNILLKKS